MNLDLKIIISFFFFLKKVSKLAKEKIEPFVRAMDREERIFPEIIKLVFENGVSYWILKKFNLTVKPNWNEERLYISEMKLINTL